MTSEEETRLHASCVAWDGRGVLILGQSGRGKSALSLALMAFGCDLVADDQVCLQAQAGQLRATAPETLKDMIEARGIGILQAKAIDAAQLHLVVDLDQTESERMPQRREITLLRCTLPLIWRVDAPHFAPAILQILKAGWSDR
ncbi:MAG: HPr kinase/phosphatase C-terminal domain-containing protein [Pseudomonadota bacterium]